MTKIGMNEKKKFELKRLSERDEASIIAEMRRVADLVPEHIHLSVNIFDKYSRIHSGTLRKRYGSWKQALEKAGLEHRFDDSNRPKSKEDLISEIREISKRVGVANFTKETYIAESGSYGSVRREFGSWRNALEAAGMQQREHGVRYTDEDCFENLFTVWMHYGRAPKHKEMRLPPSRVGPKAYVIRWTTWLKALDAFVARVNMEDTEIIADTVVSTPAATTVPSCRMPRDIPLGIRYKVLTRDRFRCVLCGRSPATDITVVLHIDHIVPWSKGGGNTFDNLRALCNLCNIGKGSQQIEGTKDQRN